MLYRCFPCGLLFLTPELPGPGSEIRTRTGWTQVEPWWFSGALRREDFFPVLCAAVDWVSKGSYHTSWSVPSTSPCSCSYAYGHGTGISQEQEMERRCAVSAFPPRTPFVTLVLPGPGSDIRKMMWWKVMCKTEESGVWFLHNVVGLWRRWVLSKLICAVDWVRKGAYHTAWSVSSTSSCSCSYAYGQGTAVGPQTGEWCWPLLVKLWRAIAPLMKPWCAEGDLPGAANLNLHRGGNSRVGWHGDDEPLFGRSGVQKLIIPVNFGSRALFRWKGKSCSDSGSSSCCIGHGDILVMDGQCQDEFPHCTDPGLEQERINVTFRWIEQHSVSCPLRTGILCCLPTCAQGSSAAVVWVVRMELFGHSGCSLESCAYGLLGLLVLLLISTGLEVGGGIICVTLGEFTGVHKSVPHVFR